jgi:hypothetical protein
MRIESVDANGGDQWRKSHVHRVSSHSCWWILTNWPGSEMKHLCPASGSDDKEGISMAQTWPQGSIGSIGPNCIRRLELPCLLG